MLFTAISTSGTRALSRCSITTQGVGQRAMPPASGRQEWPVAARVPTEQGTPLSGTASSSQWLAGSSLPTSSVRCSSLLLGQRSRAKTAAPPGQHGARCPSLRARSPASHTQTHFCSWNGDGKGGGVESSDFHGTALSEQKGRQAA